MRRSPLPFDDVDIPEADIHFTLTFSLGCPRVFGSAQQARQAPVPWPR